MGYKEKSKTKRGRSQDRKLVAFTSDYEKAYIKTIVKEQLKLLNKQNGRQLWGVSPCEKANRCSKAKLIRICKALIKKLA